MSTTRIIILIAFAFLLFSLELIFGSVHIPFSAVWEILTGRGGSHGFYPMIVLESRLPRALTAILGGSGLALSGLLMQTLFRNPLAGPSVLGISSGASLGVAILVMASGGTGIVVGGYFSTAIAAMAGSFLVLLLVMAVAERLADNTALLIFGIMLSYFTSAVVSALQFKASSESLRTFVIWGMGSFTEANYGQITFMLLAVAIAIGITLVILPRLNVLLLGDDYARSMGINVKRTRFLIIVATGIIAGIITAFCGPVAFIGLAVPHLARTIMKTSDHPRLIFPVLMTGAITGLLCDLLARMLELPMNTIACALGAPVVIFIVFRGARSKAII